jgi:hypothetical protein
MSTLPKLSQINTIINKRSNIFDEEGYNPLWRTDSNQAVIGREDEETDRYNPLHRTDSDDICGTWGGDRTRDIIDDFPSKVSFATEVNAKTYELSSEEKSRKKRWNVELKTKTREARKHMRWVKRITR